MVGDTSVETRGDSLFWLNIVFPSIAWLLYIGALVHKLRSTKFGLEDALLAAAVFFFTAQIVLGLKGIEYGFGRRAKDLTLENLKAALKCFYLMQITYKALGGFVKLAFLCLYNRVFERPRFRTFVRWFIVYIAAGTFAFMVASIFQCVPISYNWNRRQQGFCISKVAFWYSHAAWHVTSDFIIFLMPVPIILQLNMVLSKKIGLSMAFSLGLFTCIASSIRMSTLLEASKSKDPTYGSYHGMQWTLIDASFSIICACLPVLRKPFSNLMHHLGFQRSSRAERSYQLDEMPSSSVQSHICTEWDPVKKVWHEDRNVQERKTGGQSRRGSMGNESTLGIIRTTDIDVMRHSMDETAKDSHDSHSITGKKLERRPTIHIS